MARRHRAMETADAPYQSVGLRSSTRLMRPAFFLPRERPAGKKTAEKRAQGIPSRRRNLARPHSPPKERRYWQGASLRPSVWKRSDDDRAARKAAAP